MTGVKRDNIILVPGNHDLNHERISLEAKDSRKHLKSREMVNRIIASRTEREIYSSGLSDYREFLSDLFPWAVTEETAPLSYTIL